jgi:hypothetical protein
MATESKSKKAAANEAATNKASLKTGTKLGTGTKVSKGAPAKPASKPAKAPKEKAPKAEGEGGRRGRAPAWPLDAKIKVLVENPKRAGTASHDRFALYGKGTTVGAFLEAGGTSGDLHWDSEHEYISIG